MLKLMKILRNWIPSIHEGPFEYSSEGFTKARRWAKNQDHPKFPGHPRLSLWDYVNDNFIDSEHKLNEINKVKTKKKNYI
jgi:hypothetical protein